VGILGLRRAMGMFAFLANRKKEVKDLMPDGTTIQFELKNEKQFYLSFSSGKLSAHDGRVESPSATIRGDKDSFLKLLKGEMRQEEAFFMRKLEVTGPVTYLVRLNRLGQKVMTGGGFFSKLLLKLI
jgi:putative sterol carrier protein